VPPDSAPSTAELVSITGVGDHPPPATATPAGITNTPIHDVDRNRSLACNEETDRRVVASTHVKGDWADDPAGRDSEEEPRVPVAAYGSLPATRLAPPVNVHVELSKSPPGASSYLAKSNHRANGWLSAEASQALRLTNDVGLTTFAGASETIGARRAVTPKVHAIETVLIKRRLS
jgi:hypothetical protein